MKQIIFTMLLFFFSTFCVSAQQPEKQFEDSYTLLADMLENPEHYSFKKAVFSAENAYLEGALDTVLLNQKIRFLGSLSKAVSKAGILEYAESDKDKVSKWAAVFKVMTDTIPINNNGEIVQYIPFGYDFEDVFGHQTRENLFVSKLLATRKGNCHSLPYLYKILAEEIGSDAHLSLAPNHVYIKHRSQKDGYYNTELTSKIFPVDAWIMASGYIHIDAMRNSVFMKALGNKESIALVLVDLAENYNAKFPDNDGRFVLQCCELALQQYPHFSTALILRAETHYKQIEKEQDQAKHDLLFAALEKEYAYIHKLGYRDMPEDMYLNWLVSLKTERSKYENQNLSTFKGKKAAPKEEELSEKEKARRKKNIEAGNPFIKYGSTIPVATLSKGKYLEFHDLDSIVSIGTMRWQVDQKKIVGRVVRDSLDPDAQPTGNIAGRWISPDPLSEEFPSWSPYNYAMNNPINMIDPDGRSPLDIIVTAKDGTKLFTLDDGKKTITTVTLEQLYKNKVQWFEPLADNYMPLKSISKGLSSDKLKHFTKKDIENFSNKDRNMISYRKGGSGDWKKVKEGGDGYLAVTIDNMPYWGDAVGQIPFATNKAKDEIKKGWDPYTANVSSVQTGQKYADGNPFGGVPDYSNSYDNYFILRGALYGSEGRDITRPITKEEAKKYGYKEN